MFGGGKQDRKTTGNNSVAQQPATGNGNYAPKPQGGKKKKMLTKKQKNKRIIIAVAVVMVLIATATALAVALIRPPTVAKPPQNDATIKDTENGDAISTESLLNAGERVDDVFTFVVCATDEDQTRTDAMMVGTMDTKKKTVNVMNIPRDTMCNNGISGAAAKINAAYGMRAGIEQTKKEIERLMGFEPDKFIVVNFDGIAEIVDALGGVDYEIPFRMEYSDPSQNLYIDLNAGMQHLSGKQVVEFLRWRHNDDYSVQYTNGDEGRVENQQKFLKYLAGEVFQMKNVTKIPSFADAVFKNVKTDFTAGELLWLGMQAMQIKNENLQFFTLPGYGAMSTAGSDPVPYSFFFPYYQQTLDIVNEYFNPYSRDIVALDMVSGPNEYSSSYTIDDSDDDYTWGDSTQQAEEPEIDYPADDPESGYGEEYTGNESTGGSNETVDNEVSEPEYTAPEPEYTPEPTPEPEYTPEPAPEPEYTEPAPAPTDSVDPEA